VPEWLWSIIVGLVVVGLIGLIWRTHEDTDKERDSHIWDQIGRDSDKGMRRTVHQCANDVTGIRGTLSEHEKRLRRIESFLKGKLI